MKASSRTEALASAGLQLRGRGKSSDFIQSISTAFQWKAKRPISSRLPFFDPLTLEMLVGESLSRRHRGTIPGAASQGGRLSYAIVCSSEPPRRFQARTVLDIGRSVARYFSGQMSRPGGAWPSSLRGGLPGISPHPRSPGVPWVWHDAPLRVFLLQRIGTQHTLYIWQTYDGHTV